MKANRIVCVLLLVVLLVLTGCGKANDGGGGQSDFSGLVELPAGAAVLKGSELRRFEKWFSDDPIRIRFLTSTYESPEYVDLYALFYFGSGNNSDLSIDDIRAFLSQYGWWGSFEADRITEDEMSAILQKYANITFDDTKKVHINGLYRVEAEDCFYSLHGDAGSLEFKPVFGYETRDAVCLYYSGSVKVRTKMDGYFRVTLQKSENGYRFLANHFCDETAGLIEYRTETYEKPESVDLYLINESVEVQILSKDEALGSGTFDEAVLSIKSQTGFEEKTIPGQTWIDFSENGAVVSGTLDGKTVLYFAGSDGSVFNLPLPYEKADPSGMLLGGGDITLEYLIEATSAGTDESGRPLSITDYYCTFLFPTNELFIRTVQSDLAEK